MAEVEIGGGVSEFTASLLPVHHRAHQREGPAQQLCRRAQLTLGHELARARTRDTCATRFERRRLHQFPAAHRAHLAKDRQRPTTVPPEGGDPGHHQRRQVASATKPLYELLRRGAAEDLVEALQHDQAADLSGDAFDAFSAIHEHVRCAPGHDRIRVRVEGDHDRHRAQPARCLLEHTKDLLVAAMHPVKDADRDGQTRVLRQGVDAEEVVDHA